MKTYKQSSNSDVQEHLDNIMKSDPEMHAILQELRNIVFDLEEEAFERLMYGGIKFSNSMDQDWGGIYAYKNHVSFEFSKGFKLKDSSDLLEGKGKERRHIKIRKLSDIDDQEIGKLVKQAIKG